MKRRIKTARQVGAREGKKCETIVDKDAEGHRSTVRSEKLYKAKGGREKGKKIKDFGPKNGSTIMHKTTKQRQQTSRKKHTRS